ncbi:MAG TPA: hypothetical protein PLY93_10270 [Turneriella sp.]|nr:hypothetical protein [Turneriella sp.]
MLCLHTGVLSATVRGGRLGTEFSYGDTFGLFNAGLGSTYNGLPSMAFWYHFTDWVAVNVRTGFYMTGGNRQDSYSSSKENYVSFGTSIEVPFYVARFERVHLYLAPSFGYTFNWATSSSTDELVGSDKSKLLDEFFSTFAVFGVQIEVMDQLHIIGRTTLGYIWGNVNQDYAYGSNRGRHLSYFGFQSWSLGAVVYFN